MCWIHLFPTRMLHSWQCGADPSGGQQERGGRQTGRGGWKKGVKNEGSVQRDITAQPRHWPSRGAGAATGSDVSADRMKFSRGQQGEDTVATMQESRELRKNCVWEQGPAKQGHSRQGENDRWTLVIPILSQPTHLRFCVVKIIILVCLPLKSGLWVQKPYQSSLAAQYVEQVFASSDWKSSTSKVWPTAGLNTLPIFLIFFPQ